MLLALTPRGREIGQRIMEYNQQGLESLLADWSDEDVRTLKRLLARLARNAMWELQAPRGYAEPGRRRRA